LARAEGLLVEVAVVADDVAIVDSDANAGRRGLAGTVLVHKIAGAAAESGRPLPAVAELARAVAANLGTMGVGLTPVTVPAAGEPAFTLDDDEIELGLGIHGEPGIRREKLRAADLLVADLVERIVADRGLVEGDRVVALVGSTGATPPMELNIICRALAIELSERGIGLLRLWSGLVMTSLDMAGFSITLLGVADVYRGADILTLLDSPTGSLAWPGGGPGEVPELRLVPVPRPDPAPLLASDHDDQTRAAIDAICRALLDQEAELTRLDQVVGDGDLGTALARGARAWLRDPIDGSAAQLLRRLSEYARREIGGTSGPLYAAGLLRASERLADGAGWPHAFVAGVESIKELGGAAVGDRTMIDALEPAAAAAGEGLAAAVAAARAGAASTTANVARRGRSSYLGDRVRGHPDPGAVAVAVWLTAIAPPADIGSRTD
jgi:dihydroxyacetone kinase